MLKVLVACEFSGAVRDAFLQAGHYAVSVDLIPTRSRFGDTYPVLCADGRTHSLRTHHIGDVLDYVADAANDGLVFDLMIAHPPCTYLSSSGLHWNKRGRMVNGRPRAALTEEALAFVQALMDLPIRHKAVENPIGCISTRIRKPDQIIHPHQFGHDASKATCLWLENLPPLVPTQHIPPRMIGGRPRWANQTDSGQNRLGPSEDRAAVRAITYPGIAEAMVNQWALHVALTAHNTL